MHKKPARKLIEGEDYYREHGRVILTEKFLRSKGKCCHHNCRHCPWKNNK